MTDPVRPVRVAALYQFARLDAPEAIKEPLLGICIEAGARGSLLLAREGINGTIAGSDEAIETVLAHIRTIPGCRDIEVKNSRAGTMPFERMKVRLKREIVTMGEPDIDPLSDVGHYVPADEWNALIEDPHTILIDTRNDYEVAIGTFKGAIDPRTKTFREFPSWFRENRDALLSDGAKRRVAMFCTGGIRCEKATAFVKAQGIDEVYHLKGGILGYLENVPAEKSLWEGECFVFDQRVAVGHGLTPGSHVSCEACGRPVSVDDRSSPQFVPGRSCPACHEPD